ncbi:ABC transporter ATP-binding protein [Streptococcus oriscaviae]|uniref:ABC transporter ATP-binding protein n=1 Tax=Streptococcus oriscaviae TaxID=2781599 RepID=A0ABX7YLV8_9STRE|nr:ABC transporter ATP-binding protein [Streptococcus oriscaviae]QUE54468.1 ABC transporter ATP-binding protein [Streptococcus oriscaviae]
MKTIEINQLVKRYKELLALDHFNLEVREGEILGFLGPNGCGKTTAINCMLGLLTYDKGDIRIFGEAMTPNTYHIKENIGLVPQELAYFEQLTVYENIDFFCGLYIKDKQKRKSLVDEAISFVGLEDYRKFFPNKLSGGLKRRLNIACGIAHKPKLIFLDEPTVAVDAQSRNFILEGIKRLNKEGSTIVYTTHYLDEADQLCDRIVIMDKGHNVVDGTPEELKSMIATKEIIHLELVEEASADIVREMESLPHLQLLDKNKATYILQFTQKGSNIVALAQLLNQHGLAYLKLYSEQPSLSDVFLSFTGKELRD